MAHSEHNRQKKSGAFFLVILGALLFMISPLWFANRPEIGFFTIALGFAIGGLGFYLRFARK